MWPRPVTPQDMAAAVAATTTAATGVSLTAMNNAANTHEGEVALAVPDAVARALGQVLVAAGQQAASAQKEGSEGDDSDEEVMDLTRDEEVYNPFVLSSPYVVSQARSISRQHMEVNARAVMNLNRATLSVNVVGRRLRNALRRQRRSIIWCRKRR